MKSALTLEDFNNVFTCVLYLRLIIEWLSYTVNIQGIIQLPFAIRLLFLNHYNIFYIFYIWFLRKQNLKFLQLILI